MGADPLPRRSNARRSRERILAAARALFAETADVSMAAVARRAGVGPATLYRHFPDRTALAEVIAEEVRAEFRAVVAATGDEPDGLEQILRSIAELQIRLQGLVSLMRAGSGDHGAGELTRARAAEALTGPLERAKAAVRIRADIELDDLLAINRMLEGPLADAPDPAERRRRGLRLFDLILRGLRP